MTIKGRLAQEMDGGAALIVALVFITVGSFLVVALTNLTGTNLLNTSGVQAQRNIEYAADAATDAALQSSRYHSSGTCSSFSLELSSAQTKIDGFNVYVSCVGLPVTVTEAAGSSTLTAPAGTFVQEDVGQQVAYTSACCTLSFATVQSVTDSTTATASLAAPANTTNATVGNPFVRTVVLYACASTSAISSCSSTSAIVTAVVQFSDLNQNANPATGYALQILRWEVNTAKG